MAKGCRGSPVAACSHTSVLRACAAIAPASNDNKHDSPVLSWTTVLNASQGMWRCSVPALRFARSPRPLPLATLVLSAPSSHSFTVLKTASEPQRQASARAMPEKRAMVKIGTHSGTFHCDEALGCYLLSLTEQFKDASITRRCVAASEGAACRAREEVPTGLHCSCSQDSPERTFPASRTVLSAQ